MSRRAADMREEAGEFLWNDRLPVGHISVVAGKPGIGKSTLGYRVAADCNVNTLFITTEEVDKSVFLPKYAAAGGDKEKAWIHPEVQFTRNPLDREYLLDLIKAYEIKLIVVDPAGNHIGASMSHDVAVRNLMAPYLDMFHDHRVALLLEAHVLRDVNVNADAQLAFPSGLRGIAKAMYLLAKDPTLGADPEMRVLATAKFNFAQRQPASRLFEFDTGTRSVYSLSSKRRVDREYGMLLDRGETKVTSKMLLITLAPEDKERLLDRAAFALVEFLQQGKQGRMQPVSAIRKLGGTLDPQIGFKTFQRAMEAMPGIESVQDPRNKSLRWWRLTDEQLGELQEADDESTLNAEWVDAPDDTFPEDWVEGEDGS
jgi:hypothetical protein